MSNVKITANNILALNKWIKPERAEEVAKGLVRAAEIASLNTDRRVRHFVAQCAYESAGFTRLVESFAYKDPRHLDAIFRAVRGVEDAKALMAKGPDAIANRVYANRLGNGDEASGDGARYKGRGWLQLTGKFNYAKAEKYSGISLVKDPGLAGRIMEASIIAAHFWRWNNINDEADQGDLAGVTRLINGPAMDGLEDRKTWLLKTFKVWPG